MQAAGLEQDSIKKISQLLDPNFSRSGQHLDKPLPRIVERALKLLTPASWWFDRVAPTSEQMDAWFHQSQTQHPMVSCKHLHPNHCLIEDVLSTCRKFNIAWKVYALVHIVPHLLFKKDKFSKQSLKKLLISILKTYAWFLSYLFVSRTLYCYVKDMFGGFKTVPGMIWVQLAGLSIFFEPPNRRAELGLYFLSKIQSPSQSYSARGSTGLTYRAEQTSCLDLLWVYSA